MIPSPRISLSALDNSANALNLLRGGLLLSSALFHCRPHALNDHGGTPVEFAGILERDSSGIVNHQRGKDDVQVQTPSESRPRQYCSAIALIDTRNAECISILA